MTQAAAGNRVKVHYTGTLDGGAQFDSSVGRDPLEFTPGGGVNPGFETAIIGMAQGDSKTVKIPATEAYGPHHADRVMSVEHSKFPQDIELEAGRRQQAVASGGETLDLMVVAVGDINVTLDFNHPLAGQNLTFALELAEIV